MAKRVSKKEETPAIDVVPTMTQYVASRNLKSVAAEQEDRYKKLLMEYLAEHGELVPDKGHRTYGFNEPIDGGKLGRIVGIRRTRRVTQSLNEEKLMALIAKHKEPEKLKALMIKWIPVIDEDGVLAANFQDLITNKELESLYDESETFAFDLTKG